MPLYDKQLEAITENDLQELIASEDAELRTIEYKRNMVGQAGFDKPSDRTEFLADVSSFANAHGGDLVLGMDANDGVPTEIVGLPGITVDIEISRLEDIVRNGISPGYPSECGPLAPSKAPCS